MSEQWPTWPATRAEWVEEIAVTDRDGEPVEFAPDTRVVRVQTTAPNGKRCASVMFVTPDMVADLLPHGPHDALRELVAHERK